MKACQQPLSMVRARLPLSPPKRMPKGMRRVQSYQRGPPIAAVQEMSDLLDADLGRPALEVLTRLCDQGVRPASVSPSGQPDRRARHAGQSDGARGRRTGATEGTGRAGRGGVAGGRRAS